AGGALLQEIAHAFSVAFYDYSGTPLAGLWHAFTAETQTDERQYEGSSTPVVTTTTSAYDQSGYQSRGPYGNLTSQAEYDGATLVRTTEHCYATLDTGTSYIVDRPWADDTRDGANRLLALTHYFYDGLNTSPST